MPRSRQTSFTVFGPMPGMSSIVGSSGGTLERNASWSGEVPLSSTSTMIAPEDLPIPLIDSIAFRPPSACSARTSSGRFSSTVATFWKAIALKALSPFRSRMVAASRNSSASSRLISETGIGKVYPRHPGRPPSL